MINHYIKRFFHLFGLELTKSNKSVAIKEYEKLYQKYQSYTMVTPRAFKANMLLAEKYKILNGDYVECGVWRGGMSAAFAEVLGKERIVHLFDSFEGLPPAKEIDGESAKAWQKDTTGRYYYDNCKAEETFVIEAMKLADHSNYKIYKGWFDSTLPMFDNSQIAILRLDADWYDSVIACLEHLYPKVVTGGLIILDDYPFWEGCSKAVHQYLASIKSRSRIQEIDTDVTYIVKKD